MLNDHADFFVQLSPFSQPSNPRCKLLSRPPSRQQRTPKGNSRNNLSSIRKSEPNLRPSTAPDYLPKVRTSLPITPSGCANRRPEAAAEDAAWPLRPSSQGGPRPGAPAHRRSEQQLHSSQKPRGRATVAELTPISLRTSDPPSQPGQNSIGVATRARASSQPLIQRPRASQVSVSPTNTQTSPAHKLTPVSGSSALGKTVARQSRVSKIQVSPLATDKLQPYPVRSEADSLHEISAVASHINGDLDNMIESCNSIRPDYVGDLSALQEISSATQTLQKSLRSMKEVDNVVSLDSTATIREELYDDPVISRARQVAAITNKLCDELDLTSHNFGTAAKAEEEVTSLREITAVTQQVCEAMSTLQGTSWALKVLSNVSGHGAEDAEGDDLDDSLPSRVSFRPPKQKESIPGGSSGGGEDSPLEAKGPNAQADASTNSASNSTSNQRLTQAERDADMQAFLAQQGDDELSEEKLQRLQTAFRRFKVPDSMDLHTGDVIGLLEYCGHVLTTEDIVNPIVKEVTTYDYLDYDEFISFMERFIPREKEEFHRVFEKYDEDNSGEISILELKKMLKDLKFIPLQAMLREALLVADHSGNGQLDFPEFVTFLAVYRRYEGFSTDEVEDIRKIFTRYATPTEGSAGEALSAEHLADALVQVFGVHVSDIVETMEEKLKSGQGLQKSSLGAAASSGKPENLSFSEFLIFARKTREAALEKMEEGWPELAKRSAGAVQQSDAAPPEGDQGHGNDCAFSKYDTDGSGNISEKELRAALKSMGYTPLKQNIDEILAEVDKDKNSELDFGEFFDFMLIMKHREGFLKSVVEQLRRLFLRFDEDNSGEIDALELAEVFRELGYKATLEEIHVFVLQVDSSGNNQLDFPEFMRLMRLYREEELKKMLEAFVEYAGDENGKLVGSDLKCALEDLGHEVPPSVGRSKRALDFDAFVQKADSCRAAYVAKEKKKAGFSEQKITHFEELFTQFDRDRSGEIDTGELMALLKEFNWEPKSREEQQDLLRKMDLARTRAREAGVEGVGQDGSAAIKFWTFVQLARILETEHDHAEEVRMKNLLAELNFTQKEVEEFRAIFVEKKKALASDADEEVEGLPRQAIRRLLYLIGIEVKGEKKTMLDQELEQLGCPEGGFLDFSGFLRLMRWLMESCWLP